MKTKLISILLFLSFSLAFSQIDENELHCYIANNSGTGNQVQLSTPFTGTANVAFFLCVEKGQNDSIFTLNLITPLKEKMHNYFEKATLSNYHVNIADILVKSTNIQSGFSHLFVLPDTLIPYPPVDTNFVVAPWMVKNVFAQADSLYDFNNFDSDNDGIVDYVVFMVIRYAKGWSTGTAGLSINNFYETNDTLANGNHIQIDGTGYLHTSGKRAIIQRRRTTNFDKIISISVHEMGHSLFSFPDMDHNSHSTFDHYALGQFSPMSQGGFKGRASLYNPYFRINMGWVVPVELTSTSTISFTDFDDTGLIYEYDLPSYSEALPNQKIFISEFNKPSNNRWQKYWPLPKYGEDSKGIMVMEKTDNGTYSNSHRMPIQIVSAHGKWLWDRSQAIMDSVNVPYTHAINLGIEDPLKGLDSLQVRYSYIGYTWNPSIHWWDVTSVYPDGRIGSASCFYNPYQPKELSFYSNPNSNAKLNNYGDNYGENYSTSVLSNFKMKNIHIENDITKADVVVGVSANTITSNTTLAKGKWYFNKNITVASSVTLTIQEGTSLTFNNGASLVVNGTLNAQGTSTNLITFNSGSIVFEGRAASNSNLNFVNVNNGTGIKCLNGANVTIENSTIDHCTYGVYASYSEPLISNNTITNNNYGLNINFAYTPNWNKVDVQNNTIADNQYYGVYIYDSSPHLYNNNIDRNGRGVVLWQNSSPIFDHNTISRSTYYGLATYGSSTPSLFYSNVTNKGGYNTFSRNGTDGVYAGGTSNPNLGGNSTEFGGYNIFEANTNYEINNHSTQIYKFFQLNAMYNWWGQASGPLKTDFYGNVAYVPYLTNNPSANGNITNGAVELKNGFGNSPSSSIPKALLVALHKQMRGKFKQSAQQFRSFILRNNSSPFLGFAVQQFIKSAKHYLRPKGVNNFITALLNRNISNEVKVELLRNQITFLIYQENYTEANTRIDYSFAYTDANSKAYFSFLFQKAKLNILFLNDLTTGITLLNKIIAEADKTSEYYLTAELELSNIQLNVSLPKINVLKGKPLTVKEYSLAQNYPNPFNPTTTINYAIPQDGSVTLKIYNVLGAEVMTLVNETQAEGKYQVTFDASHLSSGIYIYRIQSGRFFSSKKMVLLK